MKKQPPELYIKRFSYGAALSAACCLILLLLSVALGKQGAFLVLNAGMGRFADYFFSIVTNGGAGIMWLFVAVIVFFIMKQPKVWPLLVSTCIISTIITQLFKNIIMPGVPRPWQAIASAPQVHTVPFVSLLYTSSFPSGHTATAFCVYLIFCLVCPKKWWLAAGFVYALLVGYSRIYLALHFPVDVAGGIITAILSTILGYIIQVNVYKNTSYKTTAL